MSNFPWKGYTDEQRKAVEEMAAYQKLQDLSDAKFSVGSGYTETTWGRLRRGCYQGDITEAIQAFKRNTINLRERKTTAAKTLKRKFYETPDYLALVDATKAALVESETGGQDKGVCFVAEFGGGKTTMAKRLNAHFNGVIIEALPSWRESYFAACKTVAEGLGIRDQVITARYAEEMVLAHLRANPCVLIFEEVEYSGNMLLNLWKAILNQTDTVIVVFFISRFFDEVKRRGGEYADQFLRRCRVIKASPITAATAAKFLLENFPDSKALREGSEIIAAASNKKGNMHLCQEVARMLQGECGGETLTVEVIQAAIDNYYSRHTYSDRWQGKSLRPAAK